MNKYKVIAICGKSASGKDTLLQAMKHNNTDLHEIVSCTTRPPRDYEIDGINYFFLTLEEFAHKDCMGEMLGVSKFREWFYGTSLDGVKETAINIGVFNPTGIYSLMQLDFVDLFVSNRIFCSINSKGYQYEKRQKEFNYYTIFLQKNQGKYINY